MKLCYADSEPKVSKKIRETTKTYLLKSRLFSTKSKKTQQRYKIPMILNFRELFQRTYIFLAEPQYKDATSI
jgi:hypothetical protein